jgi:DNA-binding transcriptional ArsR family regulator
LIVGQKNQENPLLPNRFSEVKSYILLRLAKYRDVYLTSEKEDIREELREEIRSLKDEIRHQVSQALESSGTGSIRVDLHKDDVAQSEPSFVVVKDLVRQIRENVKSSLATRGEIAVDELVDSMPETTAADLLKSLANTDRLKMVKMLYSTRKTFSDFKTVTGLEAASVNNHLKSLLNMGLVSHSDEGGYELTKRGRILVRTLALMSEALGGEQID